MTPNDTDGAGRTPARKPRAQDALGRKKASLRRFWQVSSAKLRLSALAARHPTSGETDPMNKFVFATHRGGSSVLGDITNACCMGSKENMVALGGELEVFREVGPTGAARRADPRSRGNPDDLSELFVPQIENWERHAGVFAPIRRADFFPPAFFKEGDKGLLMMRDPRDCMVSGYYGFLRLHSGGMNNPEQRANYEKGVDRYVLENMLVRYRSAVQDYIDLLEQIPAITVLTYEEMVTDFPSFFAKFYERLDFNPDYYDRLLRQQATKFEPPAAEDIDSHKRQMLPGDHARKLAPETIATINDRMGPQLRYFGYL